MSRYTTVESIIWHDEKFRSLSEDARTLFLYLLTSPHSNMLGIFYLPKLYACSDLQWDPERYQRGIDTLCYTLLIEVDKDIIWVKNYLKHNQIRGPRQVTGAVNRLMSLPDTKLIGPFIKSLEKHLLDDDFRLFKEQYTKPFVYPIDTLCDTPSIAGTGTDTGTDTVSATATDAREAPKKQDDDDDAGKNLNPEIIKSFAQAFGYPPNQTQLEMLTSFIDDGLSDEIILEALKRSAEAGASSPRYTTAILQSWATKNALTLDDIQALDNLRRPRRRDGPLDAEDYTYTPPDQDASKFSFLTNDDHDDKEDSA